MAKDWHRKPREGTTVYVRANVWLLRRPWALALIVLLEIWMFVRRTTFWRAFMALSSLAMFVLSIMNNSSQGRIERAIWPGIWA